MQHTLSRHFSTAQKCLNSLILMLFIVSVLGFLFFKILLISFLARGRERERERNINMWLPLVCPQPGTWPITQACTLDGNQTCDPLVCRVALNPLSHTGPCRFCCFLFHLSHIGKMFLFEAFFIWGNKKSHWGARLGK